MSSVNGLRQAILDERRRNAPFYSTRAKDVPMTDLPNERVRVTAEQTKDVGFQPQKKEKKRKREEEPVARLLQEHEDEPDRMDEEKEEEEAGRVWKGPNLSKPLEVQNLDRIISSVKDGETKFDSETDVGRKSNQNFFNWLEQYSRLEYRKKKDEDDRIFN